MNKQAWIKCYNDTGKLPEQKVPCTKCGNGVTMFSSNLTNRVAKFGSIDNLLNSFICKQCSSVGKPQKVKRVSKPREKKVAVEVIYDIPIYKGHVRKSIVLLDNPEMCREVTSSACFRPDLYLNADRTCDDCNLFNNCGCAIKKLSKKKSLIA
jgi:hypothetical protein